MPLTPLPAITVATTIDATTQTGYAVGAPAVVILGTSTTGDGLLLGSGSSGSVVEGLTIAGFSGAGVHVESSNDVIAADQLGVDLVGGVYQAGNGVGVLIDGGSSNTIGGVTAAAGNLIGRNTTSGVQITGTTATANVVEGNLVGVDSSGANQGNSVGVQIFNSSGNTIGGTAAGAANTVGYSAAQGVAVLSGNQDAIRDNMYSGTNGTLSPAEANDIALGPGANQYQPAPTLIAASLQSGTLSVLVSDNGTTVATGTVVTLDFYRVDASPVGRTFLASQTMTVGTTPSSVTISGTGLAAGDTIAATATVASKGTSMFSAGTTVEPPLVVTNTNDTGPGTLRSAITAANLAPGSTIRFAISGTGPFTIMLGSALPTITAATIVNGESQAGYAGSPLIVVDGGGGSFGGPTLGSGSAGSVVEGLELTNFGGTGITLTTSADQVLANVITGNTGYGVRVSGSSASGDLISQDLIFSNGGLGIDLVGGANGGQSAPTGLAATTVGTTLTVDGSVSGFAAGTYTVEFFAGSASGQAPAFEYLGSATINLAAAGSRAFTETLGLAAPLQSSQTITATVTSPANSTSVFATGVSLQSPFVVTRTGDGGAGQAVGSLRQAILDADMVTLGTTTITFAIPTSDSGYNASTKAWTIAPASALPAITTSVILDGSSQPGYGGSPVIQITGSGTIGVGLTITASGGLIKGLAVVDFTQIGIDVATSDETVAANSVGVAPDGATAGPGNSVGIQIDGSNNTIGGVSGAGANSIAFNTNVGSTGVGVDVNSGVGNLISENSIFSNNQAIVLNSANLANNSQPAPTLIGAVAFGSETLVFGLFSGLASTSYTLQFFRSAPGDPGTPGQAHVYLGSQTITTDATGGAGVFAVFPTTTGVGQVVTATATSPTNDTSALSNGVSAGTSFVVTTTADNGSNSSPTVGSLRAAILNADAIPGSRITFNLPTSDPGYDSTTNTWTIAPPTALPAITAATTIDGTSQPGFSALTLAPVIQLNGNGEASAGLTLGTGSDGSVIKGLDIANFAGAGVLANSSNNAIVGDYLGTNLAGTGPGPGNEEGVSVSGSGNTIGGSTAGASDVIAYNTTAGAAGVGVLVTTGTGNLLRQNAIFANDQQIVLASGGNNQQSAPVITGVNSTTSTGTTIIQGTVSGFLPSTVYTLEFFSSLAGDPSGAQAHVYLGRTLVTTDASGGVSYTTTLPVVVGTGQTVTATATSSSNDTSPLASPVFVSSPFTVTTTSDSGVGSLRQAILNADAQAGISPLTIRFAILGAAPYSIVLQSDLPAITRPVVLDATTETGYAGTPIVQVSGIGLLGDGIVLGAGSGGSTVQGFVISGFISGAGIHVESAGNVIAGDWLGLDTSGLGAGPGNQVGVFLDGAGSNTVGGLTAAAGDVIGFNTGAGILISGAAATGNMIVGNLIGVAASGGVLGNQIGVLVESGGNTIGGSTPGAANTVAYSASDGIQVSGVDATGNLISRNSIYANSRLAIDLMNGGNGAPSNQSFVLTDVTVISSLNETVVQGSLTAFSADTYTLEFFASGGVLPGFGEQAKTYLISATLIDNPSSPDFSIVLPVVASLGLNYTATATADLTKNTSELSTSVSASTSFVVTNTADAGQGSLRQAIVSLEQYPAAGRIGFNIPGTGTETIGLLSPLPVITVPALIDGTTQPGYAGTPIVEVTLASRGNGQAPLPPIDGLVLAPGSDGSVVTGLALVGFTGAGVRVESSNDAITGNLLGEYPGGAATGPGNAIGVWIDGTAGTASGVTIGGTAAGSGNSIGGNTSAGVSISGAGASGDLVLGNAIGVDLASPSIGTLGNVIGIAVDGAPGSTVGGSAAGAANVIGFNSTAGILISGTVAGSVAGAGTTVMGNFIGVDGSANNVGNGEGIILEGSNANLIGGLEITAGDPIVIAGPGNVVAFNTGAGIEITGAAAVDNVVEGNFIGTDPASDPLGNQVGVMIDSGASNNAIGGLNTTITGTTSSTVSSAANVIGANLSAGVEVLDPGSMANTVEGNLIGVDTSNPKLSVLGNTIGVLVEGASGNVVGGLGSTTGATVASAANVIGYNVTAGVELAASLTGLAGGSMTTSDNLVEGNYIGVDQSGDRVGNGNATTGAGAGVLLSAFAEPGQAAAAQAIVSRNTIGGTAGAAGSNPSANIIGANPTGVEILASLGGLVGGSIGATAEATGNLIAGNDVGLNQAQANLGNRVGVLISASDSPLTQVNVVPPFVSGPGGVVEGLASASGNTVGGTAEAGGVNQAGNDVGFNTQAGIELSSLLSAQPAGSTVILANTIAVQDNAVQGNLVGTTLDTTGALGNGDGVLLTASGSAAGALALAGNLIGGPLTTTGVGGASQNALGPAANLIVANASEGVVIDMRGVGLQGHPIAAGAAFNNTIEGNLISRNALNGVHVLGDLTGDNFLGQINDNFIGVTADGESAYNLTQSPPKPQGNGLSGVLLEETSGTTLGSSSSINVYGNLISGNGLSGLTVQSDNPKVNPYASVSVSGNIIGLDVTGETAVVTGNLPLGNVLDGVLINNVLGVTIGGASPAATTAGAGNVISGNLGRGVEVRGYALAPPASPTSPGDLITGNNLGTDLTGTQSGTGATYLGNLSDGVFLLVPPNVRITNNIIGDNRGAGIHAATQTSSTSTAYTANGLVTIQGNDIGTNSQGESLFNGSDGVFIDSLVPASESVGTVAEILSNLIAGNHANGVDLLSSAKIAINGNTIGGALANAANGVFLNFSSEITIGGTAASAGNVISGNQTSGILISGNLRTDFPGRITTGNLVLGNAIGVDPTRSIAAANDNTGLVISFSIDNTIGGTTIGAGNVISGNRLYGVLIAGDAPQASGSPGNILWGNLIGVSGGGQSPLANTADGVFLLNVGNEQIGGTGPGQGNVISGNSGNGVRIFGAGATNNLVEGNRIGVGSGGENVIANQGNGVLLDDSGAGNSIGGSQAGAGNVISGNAQSGILLFADTNNLGSGAVVQGNHIGVDSRGTSALPNNSNGVLIFGSAANTIGGASPAAGNVISANFQAGVSIYTPAASAQATGNVIAENMIGVDASGANPLGNPAGGVLITDSNGNNVGPGNVISGNATGGVIIQGDSNGSMATGNLVTGNLIGVSLGGSSAVPGQQNGVMLINAVGDVIGGSSSGPLIPGTNLPATFANEISGNQQTGVLISGTSSGDLVEGNVIGADARGHFAIPNAEGVFIQDLSASSSNDVIGGTAPGSGNLISGNSAAGVQIQGPSTNATPGVGSLVVGDVIGLSSLDSPLSNSIGVMIQSSPSNTIGGLSPGGRNVVSGNASVGIEITGTSSSGNLIVGSDIGTNFQGSAYPVGTSEAAPAQLIGVLVNGATSNMIGLATAGGDNVISANNVGVEIAGLKASNSNQITGSQNVVAGNLIGVDATGSLPVPNLEVGVFINNSQANVVGPGNVLSTNGIAGVEIYAQGSTNNVVTGNLIGTNSKGQVGFPPSTRQPTLTTSGGVESGIGVYADAQLNGVVILGASNNIVGQTTTIGTGPNLIAGDVQVGVYISSRDYQGRRYPIPVSNLVSGNQIGANGIYGVLLYDAPNNPAPPFGGRRPPLIKNSFHGTRSPFRNYLDSFDGGTHLKTPGSTFVHPSQSPAPRRVRAVPGNTRPRVPRLFEEPMTTAKHHPRGG